MKSGRLVADSSFYLCFLNDIKKPSELSDLLNFFDFLMTPLVQHEVSRSDAFDTTEGLSAIEVHRLDFALAQILKPLFTLKQIEKGETEVIILSYYLMESKRLFKILLDDGQPRRFVVRNFQNSLLSFMIGTVGLIGNCYCDYGYFSKERSLSILDQIEHSTFRIEPDVLITTRKRIEEYRTD